MVVGHGGFVLRRLNIEKEDIYIYICEVMYICEVNSVELFL